MSMLIAVWHPSLLSVVYGGTRARDKRKKWNQTLLTAINDGRRPSHPLLSHSDMLSAVVIRED